MKFRTITLQIDLTTWHLIPFYKKNPKGYSNKVNMYYFLCFKLTTEKYK